MRALVLIHEEDRQSLLGVAIDENPPKLSRQLFSSRLHNFDLYSCSVTGRGELTLTGDPTEQLPLSDVIGRYSTIIVVAGERALNCPELMDLLHSFIRGEYTPMHFNEAVIVVRVANADYSAFSWMMPERFFFVPPRELASPSMGQENRDSAAWLQRVRQDLEHLLSSLDENQTMNPNVGFGILLVDGQGRFFLMERLREPGRGKLGTLGGNFLRGQTISGQLDLLLDRRFRNKNKPQIDLGPLLACTNMKNAFYHYIDFTFLALLKAGNLGDVSDRELRPVGHEFLQRLPNSSSKKGGAQFTFDVEEMAAFHRENLLFAPVASAFEVFCRIALAEQLMNGRRRTISFPSLLDETLELRVRLPDSQSSLVEAVAKMGNFTKTALPFFEGEL